MNKMLFVFSVLFILVVTACSSTPHSGQSGYTTNTHYETRGDYYRGR